jgi:hypothetical protein
MNGFLLLRDNKQTGPYTIEELRKMGLKPYDLIWQEGKSAAWRYPGEIPDLADFAPPVLEQPYDRFWSKPPSVISSVPVSNSPSVPASAEKKIFVAMPEASNRKQVKSEEKPPIDNIETTAVKNYQSAEYVKINYASDAVADALVPSKKQSSGMSDRTYNILMKSIFAICLILIGFIMAIYISDLRDSRANANIPPRDPVVEEAQWSDEYPPAYSAGLSVSQDENSSSLSSTNAAGENKLPRPIQRKPVNTPAPVQQVAPVSVTPAQEEEEKVELGAEEKAAIRKSVMGKIGLATNHDYKVSAFGGVEGLKVVLTNNSDRDLNKVDIKVSFYNQNRKVVRSQMLNLLNVASGAVKEIEVPKSPRGVEFSVELVAVDPVF